MAADPKNKREAFRLYVEESRNPAQCAAAVGVSERTVQNWMARARDQGKSWDKSRSAYLLGPGGTESIALKFVPTFFALINSTIRDLEEDKDLSPLEKAEALSRITDAAVKAANAMAKLNPSLNRVSVSMETVKLFADYIAREFPQHAEAFMEVLGPFSQHIVNKFGG